MNIRNIGSRFPRLQVKPETFEKHKATLLLTAAASAAGSGAMFLINALGFVKDESYCIEASVEEIGEMLDAE
jgi:hypothetical protein